MRYHAPVFDRASITTVSKLLAVAAAMWAAAATAQGYPAKPIRIIVPFSPGGAADTVSRTVADELGVILGQQLVPDSRPGAAGAIGLELLAKASPDGYTLGTASEAMALLPHTRKGLPWEGSRHVTDTPEARGGGI